MRRTGKRTILAAAWVLLLPYRIVPAGLRRVLLFGLATLESRIGAPEDSLRRLFALQDDIEHLINERAMALGKGVHPKHRLMRYHDFFVGAVRPDERVLDIGCGTGAVSRDLAERGQVEVVGIDLDAGNIEEAKHRHPHPRVRYLVGDALKDLPQTDFDVVVLSNILEHLKERTEFLRSIQTRVSPDRILIRVPLFERDWRVPLRRELGLEWRLDPTHETEYTLESFAGEMAAAGLEVVRQEVRWGEIWAETRPRGDSQAAVGSPDGAGHG